MIPGGYAASVEAAKVHLEAARGAMSRRRRALGGYSPRQIRRVGTDRTRQRSGAFAGLDREAACVGQQGAPATPPPRGRPTKSKTSASKASVGPTAGANGAATATANT
jgi:hypothetical protein